MVGTFGQSALRAFLKVHEYSSALGAIATLVALGLADSATGPGNLPWQPIVAVRLTVPRGWA